MLFLIAGLYRKRPQSLECAWQELALVRTLKKTNSTCSFLYYSCLTSSSILMTVLFRVVRPWTMGHGLTWANP